MTPMLADISNSEWIMVAATVGLFVVALIALIKKSDVAVSPTPFPVEIVESLVTKDDFKTNNDDVRRALKASDQKFEREIQSLWSTLRSENTAIRREITDAVRHSEELVMDKLESNREELGGKLDGMPDRVIATLKNTGAI